MKNLTDYYLIRDFIASQGLLLDISILKLPEDRWDDLVQLSTEWKYKLDEEDKQAQMELVGLSVEELEQRERDRKAALKYENEKVLFHSSGYRPKKP